jgi:hypothetical protein
MKMIRMPHVCSNISIIAELGIYLYRNLEILDAFVVIRFSLFTNVQSFSPFEE